MAGHAPAIGIKPLPNAKVAIISSSWHLDICNDLDQAIARSGVAGSTEDKGYDSAVAALELLRLKNA